jgi:hypothetical protein
MAIMKPISFLEQILSQVTFLYQYLLSNQHKEMDSRPEIKEAIQRLSRQIQEISHMTDTEASRMGISQEELRKTILESKDHLPPDLQNFLEKTQYLKSQLEGCRNVLKAATEKQKEERKNKQLGDKRKEKFNHVGGKKGWIPL